MGLCALIIFAPSALASRRHAAKTFVRGYVELLQKYRRTTGMGAEKFEASLAERRWFGRHLWHPSDRAMMTRVFHLAWCIEQPGESLRDIAWRARGLGEREERAKTGQNGCSLGCSIQEHGRARSAQLKVRAQRGIVVLYSFSKGCGRAVDGCSDSEALPCCLPCLACSPVLPATIVSCLSCLSRLARFVSRLASPFAHRTAA